MSFLLRNANRHIRVGSDCKVDVRIQPGFLATEKLCNCIHSGHESSYIHVSHLHWQLRSTHPGQSNLVRKFCVSFTRDGDTIQTSLGISLLRSCIWPRKPGSLSSLFQKSSRQDQARNQTGGCKCHSGNRCVREETEDRGASLRRQRYLHRRPRSLAGDCDHHFSSM